MSYLVEVDVTHRTIEVGGLAFNVDTLVNTAIVCAILVGLALLLRTQLQPGVPSPLQNATEALVEFLGGLAETTMAGRGINLAPLAITLFIFLLIANWMYFNIFVGELLLTLIVILIPPWVAWLPGAVWTLFSLFVGVVQAFIFTVLTISYIAVATEIPEGH